MKTLQGVISVLLIMILALSMSGCSNLAQILPPARLAIHPGPRQSLM
ncbi:MAG TPA: hypothetical protein VF313_11350 [Anaerolineaceae bacterium]